MNSIDAGEDRSAPIAVVPQTPGMKVPPLLDTALAPIPEFNLPPFARTMAGWSLAGAGGLVLFSLLNFCLSLWRNADQLALHLGSTAPLIFACMLLSTGFRALRSPYQVRIHPEALELLWPSGKSKTVPFNQIALVKELTPVMATQKHLRLFDARGKILASLPQTMDPSGQLHATLTSRVVPSPVQNKVKGRQNRRKGIYFIIAGIAFLLLSAANTWMSINDKNDTKLFHEQSRPTSATIEQLIVAPDGRTHRVFLHVDKVANAPSVNLEVDPFNWSTLKAGDHVDVIAVPTRPDLAHLAEGEIPDKSPMSPTLMIPLSIVMGLFALTVLVLGILVLQGREINGV